mmetsp:Transcript_14439/g.28514  ORF Transcript_14439/g.28514 Transcript_14439/m.28514 type:complete len:457 (+) Transcript_14439:286-1656(+)|eukprot:CAMPEP_0173383798 /NCGR_PEP_ID=MMETSP1356-20130122/6368_1 /TAXON_ID=77927 ORGANISM="Hemiselmis virescens, Strain PCC157" /NCGR_SAMPLE_ID=MMETSP1356 /ASSEMBLY_ACC=CAM_ASM_000847 /LENGTH=456 /DNA_ID=CAMNT_0014338829 /DNA_START=249 /DNA_END=1619 /DNA_ORIENTATION=+
MSEGQDSNVKRRVAMERKAKQREQAEVKKRELKEVVWAIMPLGWASKGGAYKRKRKTIEFTGLLEDVLQCVKHVQSIDREKSDKAGQPSHQKATPGWGRYRAGMGLSQTMGTMLVHKEDVRVTESNAGMDMFVSYAPLIGYKGQSLKIVTHSDDTDALMTLVQSDKVGASASLRLLRANKTKAGCLLLQYVRKELTLSHITADNKAVLLTCPLSDEDTAPLSPSPSFFDDLYYNSDRQRGSSRIVSTQGVRALAKWMEERAGYHERADAVSSTLLRTMWNFSQGCADSMSHMIEEATKMYTWIHKDSDGMPIIQVASRLQHQDLSSDWRIFFTQRSNGELTTVSSLPGLSLCVSAGVLLPPDDEEPKQPGVGVLFFREGLLDGVGCLIYHDSARQARVKLLKCTGQVVRRDSYHVTEGSPEPELERAMHARAEEGQSFMTTAYYSAPEHSHLPCDF